MLSDIERSQICEPLDLRSTIMSTVLVITSSALGAASVSNQLVQDAIAQLRSQNSTLKVITHDLGNDSIPHLNSDSAAALRGAAPANGAQRAAAEPSSPAATGMWLATKVSDRGVGKRSLRDHTYLAFG
jgi:hypothetical protein